MTELVRQGVICRLFGLCVWAAGSICAQRYSFKLYGQDSGLANLEVLALLQDRVGFLWVATENGLYRYDGRHFRRFGAEDGLPSTQVQTMAETADGTLWVGATHGLARRVGDRFEKVDMGAAHGTRSMAYDKRIGLAIATEAGLVVGHTDGAAPGGMHFHLYSNPPPESPVAFGVTIAPEGVVWFGCGKSICRFDGNKVVSLSAGNVPPDAYTGMAADHAGNIWARSLTRLLRLPAGGRRFVAERDLPPAVRVGEVYTDRRGDLFVPTGRGIAHRTTGGAWEIIGKKNGLPGDVTRCSLEDREGSLWIGLNGTGLARWLGRGTWQSWTEAEGLNHDVVWSVGRDSRGRLWAASEGGLSRFSETTRLWQAWRDPPVLAGRSLSMAFAGDGTLWLGQFPGGAVHVDPDRRRADVYGRSEGLSDNRVLTLTLDRNGHIWVGTISGLFEGTRAAGRYHFARRAFRSADSSAMVTGLTCDSRGRVWVSTWSGVSILESGRWRELSSTEDLRNVASMSAAPDGSVWIGYREATGLSQVTLEGSRVAVRHYRKADGMPSQKILSVGVAASGQVWAGTDRGLDTFDGRRWTHYDKTDGLIGNDTNSNAIFVDGDGSVWLGTSLGLSHFLAAGSLPRPTATSAVLTGVSLGARPVSADANPSVPYSARAFHATFAAMSFVNEESVRLRYRLDGLDSSWTETDEDEARYPGLASGQYTFEVQAGADGRWSGPPARFSFRIRPPWWLSWWGILAELSLAAGITRLLLAWRWRAILRQRAALERAVRRRTRELERQKIEIERLFHASQEAARLKNEFLANISHEIRTPMNGIMGMTDLVLRSELTADQSECLRLVRFSAESLLSVINDVLDYSKIEAGKFDLDPSDFQLHNLVRDTVKSMEILARNKSLTLDCRIDCDVPDWVKADPVRLRQILINLVGNAIKFTGSGGVGVEVSKSGADAERELQFAVRDSGIGIPADKQKLIFEPFRQADGSTSRRYGGTGLGLAICARLVELMGGKIWLESRPGEGTVFYFTARVAPAASRGEPAAAETASSPAAVETRSLRVLLAEDNAVNRKLVGRVVANCGHQVVYACDGLEAVESAGRERFDIILMDVQMPHMDGFEATQEIRKLDAALSLHTPILALTANAMKGDRERCLSAGMDGYLPKPLKPAELIETIDRMTQK